MIKEIKKIIAEHLPKMQADELKTFIANAQKTEKDLTKLIKQLFYNPLNDRWWEKKVFKATNLLLHNKKYPTEADLKSLVRDVVQEYLPQKNLSYEDFWNSVREEVSCFF